MAPIDLYRRGQDTSSVPVERSEIDAALRRIPLTVVVFPGIFSEFIDTKPFHELFAREQSAARNNWDRALTEFERRHSEDDKSRTLFDEQFSLDRLDADSNRTPFARRRLDQLFEVASLDDTEGRPLVRVVLFRHERLSLETVDDFDTIAAILSRRLHKFFAVQGIPKHLVFLGYSMGAPVGLQVLSSAHVRREAWVGNVVAFLSVGGVVFGSHAADDALRPSPARHDNIAYRQVSALRTLAETLRIPADARPREGVAGLRPCGRTRRLG